jgi:hypothetical protein
VLRALPGALPRVPREEVRACALPSGWLTACACRLFVNVPALLAWVFWAFRPVLSAATFAKMGVVGAGPAAIGKAMLPLVDAAELPRRYGGTAAGWE